MLSGGQLPVVAELTAQIVSTPFQKLSVSQGLSVLVDESDLPILSDHSWHVVKTHNGVRYVNCTIMVNGKKKEVPMHRLLLKPLPNQHVDHINRNGLDNRRINLRICTPSQNRWNSLPTIHSSKFKGVSWQTDRQRWRAQITHRGKKIYIGKYRSEEDAARAYDRVARRLCGKFAWLNFSV